MRGRIQRWGNSLAVRIPKTFAAEVGLAEEAAVEITLTEGRLIIEPVTEPELTLEMLLAQVTDDNLHDEWDTGSAVGSEVW